MASAISLIVLFGTAYLLSRAYLATRTCDSVLEAVERITGKSCRGLLLGHFAMTAALSAFLPNVITAMAFAPLIPTLVDRYTYSDAASRRRIITGFAAATMWGANIGGMGSIVGSPANALLLVYVRAAEVPGAERLNFLTWASFGIPTVVVLVGATFLLLSFVLRAELRTAKATPAASVPVIVHAGAAQRRVFMLTGIFLVFWAVNSALAMMLPEHGQTAAAAAGALFGLWFWFEIMGRRSKEVPPLVSRQDAIGRIPVRGLALLAIAIAISFSASRIFGLDQAVGRITALAEKFGATPPMILFVLIAAVGFLTEAMSNSVVALVFFPVVHGAAEALNLDPITPLVAVSLMSTAPFMSPIGSPSNALVIGETRGIDYGLLVRLGFVMDVFTAGTLALGALHVFPHLLGAPH